MSLGSCRLDALLGNETLKQELRRRDGARFPQTVLLTGAEGSGKMTLGVILAAALLCPHASGGSACGQCISCRKILSGNHPDFFVLDQGDQEIPIAAARQLQSWALFLPNDGARKVAILRHSQNLNRWAQNTLLKLLEEPPGFCHFILTCENLTAMLPTVLSRCVRFSLAPLSPGQMAGPLAQRFPDVAPAVRERAAAQAQGALGRAIALCQTGAAAPADELAAQVGEALLTREELAVLQVFLLRPKLTRQEFSDFCRAMCALLHAAARLAGQAPGAEMDGGLAHRLARQFSLPQLCGWYDYTCQLQERCRQNAGITNLTTAASVGYQAILRGQGALLEQFQPLGGYEFG